MALVNTNSIHCLFQKYTLIDFKNFFFQFVRRDMKIKLYFLSILAVLFAVVTTACSTESQTVMTAHSSTIALPNDTVGILWSSTSLREVYNPAGNIYAYAPSIVVEANTEHIWTCHNKDSGIVKDHVYYTKRVNGLVISSNPVLFPGTSGWDRVHVCDTSIVKGDVSYNGVQYVWVMFYLGNDLECSCHNAIGVAVSQDVGGPWIKYPAPLITYADYATNTSYWGVGQQSATVINASQGRFALFYRQDDSSGYRAMLREVNLHDLNNPVLGTARQVTTAGWDATAEDSCCFINFDVAYDPTRNRFFALGEQYPFSGSVNGPYPGFVDYNLNVYSIASEDVWQSTGQWRFEGSINPSNTGFYRNHNAGIKRDLYGLLPDPQRLDVILTDSCANDPGSYEPCDATEAAYSYDLWELSGRLVDGQGVKNLAYLKSVEASSQYNDAYAPAVAADGSVNAGNSGLGWSPASGGTPWWEVDLGQPFTLKQIELVSRQGLDQPIQRRNFQVWASNSKVMSPGTFVVLGNVDGTGFRRGSTWTLEVNSTTKYRYIAFVKTVAEDFFIAEARVFGTP
jgi:F5/8 type C domain